MKTGRQDVRFKMPMLSPAAAYALSSWLFNLAHEIDLYYGDEIRSYQRWRDDEQEPDCVTEDQENQYDDDIDF